MDVKSTKYYRRKSQLFNNMGSVAIMGVQFTDFVN